jgi:hypothetical protein
MKGDGAAVLAVSPRLAPRLDSSFHSSAVPKLTVAIKMTIQPQTIDLSPRAGGVAAILISLRHFGQALRDGLSTAA